MANTFTDVVPILVAQGLQTLRAACTLPRLVNVDYANEPANVGDTVNVWIPGPMAALDVAPTAAPFQANDIQPVKAPIALNKWKHSGFYLTDKQQEEVVGGVKSKQTGEAVKALAQQINADIFAQYYKVYGIVGTPGTTPFATDTTAATNARAILNKQLAPLSDRRVVLDVNAEANAMNLQAFAAAFYTGTAATIVEGQLGRRFGMDFYMDQQVPTHPSVAFTAGAVTVNGAQTVNQGTLDTGRTGTVSLAKATNAGTLIAGDILTFAGDLQTYTVLAPVALIIGNTTVSISPALQVVKVGGEAVTLKAAHVLNLAFHRDAFALVSRPLQSASANTLEVMSVADPISGITLRLEVVRQNKQLLFDFDVLYGTACVRPELACRIAG